MDEDELKMFVKSIHDWEQSAMSADLQGVALVEIKKNVCLKVERALLKGMKGISVSEAPSILGHRSRRFCTHLVPLRTR